jgi:uncharacterized membrane protein YfcA
VTLAPEVLLLLAGAAFVAGMVDAIAGGGGLITVPALLLAGLDPASAVATNKLQGVFGTASATRSYARAGHVDLPLLWPAALGAGIGALAGSLALGAVPTKWLSGAMPVVLVLVALYFALSPAIRADAGRRRIHPALFAGAVAPVIGFYDGVFGPGAGSFYLLGLVTLVGLKLLPATGGTKLLNLASNGAALLVFALSGRIVWIAGFAMAVGTLAGAWCGSQLALRAGARLIRPALVLVSLAVAAKLLSDPAHPLRVAFAHWF